MDSEKVKLKLVNGVWEVEYDGKKGNNNQNYPKVKVGKGDGPTLVEFTIENPGNITFSAGDPIWVNDNSKPQGKHQNHDQIAAAKVQPQGKKLLVFDWNDREVDIHYRLNFDNAPPLDPIIENGGVGSAPPPPPPSTDYVGGEVSSLEMLAGVMLFLLGLAAGRFWARRPVGPERP